MCAHIAVNPSLVAIPLAKFSRISLPLSELIEISGGLKKETRYHIIRGPKKNQGPSSNFEVLSLKGVNNIANQKGPTHNVDKINEMS